MKNFLKKPISMFVLGLLAFLVGFCMLSPLGVMWYGENYGAQIATTGGTASFVLLYLFAVILGVGGLGAMILSFPEPKPTKEQHK